MIKIKLDKLKNSGYEIIEDNDKIIIRYYPPSINEASESDEDIEMSRVIELYGIKEGDYVKVTEAYVINGRKRKIDESELELWAEYLGES